MIAGAVRARVLTALMTGILSLVLATQPSWAARQPQADQGKTRVSFLVSPDGECVAYGIPEYDERANKITRLMVCGLDGSHVRAVGTVPGHYTFAQDELLWLGMDRLACSEAGSLRYVVVSVDGTRLPDINLPKGYRIVYKRLSPNGQRVAFVGWPSGAKAIIKQGLFLVELSTGHVRHLINKKLRSAPAWSPDSSKLAIGNAPMYQWTYPLVIVDVESGQVSKTGIKGAGASWSPGGQFIACTTDFVKRRGSMHSRGVPVNGRIGVFDVTSKQLIHVSPAARGYDVEGSEHQGGDGALGPVWSSDGQWIAYRRVASIRRRGSDETWIADKEGNENRKIMDGFHPLAWAHDNQSLFILKETEIVRTNLQSLESMIVASWKKGELPEVRPEEIIVLQRSGVIVRLTRVDKAHGEALACILVEARREYEETFGLSLPKTIELHAKQDPRADKARLWTDGDSYLFLTVPSKEQLAPSPQSGVSNIYGMCHELGHMVMYRRMKNLVGLPRGVGQGWAHYAGSVVVDAVARRLGKDIWPEPYDVAAVEGTARLKEQVEGKEWAELAATQRVAKVFYELEKRHGRRIVGRSLSRALSERPSVKELMPLFVQSL